MYISILDVTKIILNVQSCILFKKIMYEIWFPNFFKFQLNVAHLLQILIKYFLYKKKKKMVILHCEDLTESTKVCCILTVRKWISCNNSHIQISLSIV